MFYHSWQSAFQPWMNLPRSSRNSLQRWRDSFKKNDLSSCRHKQHTADALDQKSEQSVSTVAPNNQGLSKSKIFDLTCRPFPHLCTQSQDTRQGRIHAQNARTQMDGFGDNTLRQFNLEGNKTTLRADHHDRWC